LSSPLEAGNLSNSWTAAAYNEYLDQVVMITSDWAWGKPDLYMATSSDGVNFGPRQAIAIDAGEQFYPSIIGSGPDPLSTGQSFYVYYTDSKKGAWSRWSDAKLMRREITFDPYGNWDPMSALSSASNQSADGGYWGTVGDFGSDFQGGTPAEGWQYVWNPKGKITNPKKFEPLLWSEQTQSYNTTGGALMKPTDKDHKDDYLHLTANGGHPGQTKYMPIAGYTIQPEDGAGVYRLSDSSIYKYDRLLSGNEDGLNVMVYVNKELIGGQERVSTNGLATDFNRDLGQLNVGDTIWVMVDPLNTQYYDAFRGFDFSIQKLFSSQSLAFAASMVPEPTSVVLLVMAATLLGLRRPRRVR
jgi:hypothetical protein